MCVPMTWNPDGLADYAKNHSIRECAKKFGCTYSAMTCYLRRHGVKHGEGRLKGKLNPLYKHGHYNTRLHKIWQNMRSRCLNQKTPDYKYYGGRGIEICKDWDNFVCFEKWAINNGYTEELTLDRINVNGNYNPSNCRWVTRKVQSNNRRNTRLLEYKGEIKTLTQWSEFLNIPKATLYSYLKSEKTLEKAICKFQRRKICVV